jgi:uncharacterized protein YlxW (UPF0749 family)
MTQNEKERIMDRFIQIGNEVSKIQGQYKQLQAHIEQYSKFFEDIWNDGYKQGKKDTLLKNEVRISKSN